MLHYTVAVAVITHVREVAVRVMLCQAADCPMLCYCLPVGLIVRSNPGLAALQQPIYSQLCNPFAVSVTVRIIIYLMTMRLKIVPVDEQGRPKP